MFSCVGVILAGSKVTCLHVTMTSLLQSEQINTEQLIRCQYPLSIDLLCKCIIDNHLLFSCLDLSMPVALKSTSTISSSICWPFFLEVKISTLKNRSLLIIWWRLYLQSKISGGLTPIFFFLLRTRLTQIWH